IVIDGHDDTHEADKVRSTIGIVFQENTLDSGLTAQENLEFHCMMYHIPRSERHGRIKDVLHLMELTEVKDRLVKTFSGGMRRRLEIARGLLHEPRLLILDEPTVGLDPQTRNYIWRYVRQLREQHDTTVFMTTHYMDEAENCDRIAIIERGVIIALDTPNGLRQLVAEDQIEIIVSDPSKARQLIESSFALQPEVDGKTLLLRVTEANRFIPRLLSETAAHQLEVESLQVHRASLEDVFIKLTGRKIRDEDGSKDQFKLNMRQMGRA
ncbi:MAG TPA: ATP-binding cassette domain-containing protein, partial [Phototrophicaceae bacterium]|nr:ATP-binding cassette domain-containing protein [Phototrophicaceae bacterium]